MPNTFFNSNRKIPYIKLETLDGEIKLGRNTVLNQAGDFNDDIFLKDVSVTVASNYVQVEVTLEVLYRAWTNATFDDVLNKLVEEPYRLSTQREDGTKPATSEGIWVLQFGWRGDGIEEDLTPPLNCVTTANDITALPEARGAMQIKKTMIMLPLIYLNQTNISLLTKTREYITNQIDAVNNEQQANIIPLRIFELIVDDLRAIHGSDAPGLPTLDSFLFSASNFFNSQVGAETVFQQWIKQPLFKTAELNAIVDTELKDRTTVMSWLYGWLGDNQMQIIPTPLRVFSDNGDLGFVIRVANVDTEQDGVEIYDARADRSSRDYFRYHWEPELDIMSRTGIVENATFQFGAGQYTAAYYSAARRIAERGEDQRIADDSTDVDREAVRNRSLFLEALKSPNKKATLTLMGQPNVSVLDFVIVNANNPLFDGQYTILEVAHEISSDGFMTVIECIRVIKDKEQKPTGVNIGE